jgi:2-polyprenyl-3-methyl-5-hydroxy-6-metoxy-1,4-benzoquinol methylase
LWVRIPPGTNLVRQTVAGQSSVEIRAAGRRRQFLESFVSGRAFDLLNSMNQVAREEIKATPLISEESQMRYEDNTNSIKYHVKLFILQNQQKFKNKVVIDAPAGAGVTSRILKEVGATVHAYDLFPEYFQVDGVTCERANIMERIPVPDNFADALVCQEGIEHFSDQYRAFQEFNRVIKENGSLFITTPNYSNLQSRLSHFLFESEYFPKLMPANEADSIWMADQSLSGEIYLGHIFLIGIQKLRLLAKLSGFKIKQIVFTYPRTTSLVLLPFAYPFIWLASWLTYRRSIRKGTSTPMALRQQVYQEIMRLNTSARILVDKYLFVEFEKEAQLETVRRSLHRQHRTFNRMS